MSTLTRTVGGFVVISFIYLLICIAGLAQWLPADWAYPSILIYLGVLALWTLVSWIVGDRS